jgi:hypothetical protein
MKFIEIRKKSENTWLHISDTGSFLISKFYFKLDNNTFQITERGGVKRHIYKISEISVFDDINGGSAEFFTNQVQLYERLLFLRYSGFENNINSYAYADSKVSDAIVDGVTSVAPSQNAVFDALTLKANSASPTFTGSVVVPDATADNQAVSLGQLLRPQIEVSGNQTAVTGWNGKEITFITNGILTVQGTLPEQFNFALRADNSTITWAITAPFTWRVDGLTVGTAPPTMSSGQIAYVSRRLNTNEIRVSGL